MFFHFNHNIDRPLSKSFNNVLKLIEALIILNVVIKYPFTLAPLKDISQFAISSIITSNKCLIILSNLLIVFTIMISIVLAYILAADNIDDNSFSNYIFKITLKILFSLLAILSIFITVLVPNICHLNLVIKGKFNKI